MSKQAEIELNKLVKFILKEFPDEIGKGNPVYGESVVDVAIRLIKTLRANLPEGTRE